jgi:hypothetical protein
LLISATKFAPVSISTPQRHGSKPLAVMAPASFSTKALSLVLCDRKTFMVLRGVTGEE